MRRLLLAVPLAALSVVGWPTSHALAQATKTARGTLTAMAADSVTVKVGATDMKFTVDDKTEVEAPGAGTKARQAAAAGKAGAKLADVVKIGQAVEVNYHDMGGTLHAAMIKRVSSAGSAGVPGTTSTGKVSAVSATSLTIAGSAGGGAAFTQTFTIDPKTRVTGRGAGTAAAAKGGKAVATDLIAMGDTVSVSYREEGTTLHASSIRVTAKATK
jgi:Domain of unknown function (DUF5666)